MLGDKTPLVFFGSLSLYSIYEYADIIILFFLYVETYVNYLQGEIKMKLIEQDKGLDFFTVRVLC